MTTVSELIVRAMRMNGVLADGANPTAEEASDALLVFNQMQRSFFGDLIGTKLEARAGATGTVLQGAMYQVGALAVTLTLPSAPKDGWRFGVADANNGLATYNCTIAPNGRKIEDSTSSLVLSTASTYRTWFFRADTGDWVREKDLEASDTIYFPDDLIRGLSGMLAVALAEEYGREPTAIAAGSAQRGEALFRERYGRRGSARSTPAVAVQK